MRHVLLCLLACAFGYRAASAQVESAVLRANSPILDVQDGDRLLKGVWIADPALELDVYDAHRTLGPKRVTFKSDLGELGFDVLPNHTYDFVIALEGRGPCRTRISTATGGYTRVDAPPTGPAVIPISIEGGKLHVRGTINGSEELDLILDTGADMHALYPSAERKGVKVQYDGTTENLGGGGVTTRRTSGGNTLELAGLRWDHERLLSIEKQFDEADGIVGFHLFEGKVIELDYARGLLTLHDSVPAHAASYGKTELRFVGALPAIEVELVRGADRSRGVFVLDTAGTGAANATLAFATEHGLHAKLERLGTSRSRGVGSRTTETAVLRVPELVIAGFRVPEVPLHAELPLDGAGAVEVKGLDILGMELLQRFDTLLDYPRGVAYFRPNQALDAPFKRRTSGPSPRVLAWLGASAVALLALAALVRLRGRSARRRAA